MAKAEFFLFRNIEKKTKISILQITKEKKGGIVIEQLYVRFLDIYRLALAVFFAYIISQTMVIAEVKTLLMLVGLALYAIVFALFGNRKLVNYTEWIVVILGIMLMKEQIGSIVFIAVVIPAIKIVSNRIATIENVLVSLSLLLLTQSAGINMLTSVFISLSFFIFIMALSLNFRKIGILEEETNRIKKENLELTYESSKKDNQVEIISKLFYRKKRMEEIKSVRGIIEEIVVTASELYNADYAVLYQFKNGLYERAFVKGNPESQEIPKQIHLEKGKQFSLTKKKMMIPIEYEKRAWGLLVIEGKKSDLMETGRKIHINFESSDLEIIYMYLETALARLKEVKLTNKLTEAAFYDRLTAVPNRAHLEKELFENKLIEMREQRRPFAVLMVDIDSFKSFNDTFGHAVGDDVLKSVARIATASLDDKSDSFGRWGGEEFVAYLSGTPKEIQQKAEKIRKNIADFDFPKRRITISGGVAFYGKDGKSLKEVMEKADQALYVSKEKGKNQITFYHMIEK